MESIVGNEALAGLVRVEEARLLAEALVQFLLRSARLDAEEIVEGDIGAIVGYDFVVETEDLMVCTSHVSWASNFSSCMQDGEGRCRLRSAKKKTANSSGMRKQGAVEQLGWHTPSLSHAAVVVANAQKTSASKLAGFMAGGRGGGWSRGS